MLIKGSAIITAINNLQSFMNPLDGSTAFDQSTFEVAHIIKKYSNDLQIKALAGGGETISAIKSAKAENGFTYISNAGGAFLEWLEGKESPGIKALKENINF